MAGVNRVILLGHLGRDPEVRYQPNGGAIATLNLATSEAYKDREGNRQERTEWHRVVFFGRPAEIAGEYLRKGSMAYVEGRLQTRKWNDKEGQERYTTEIVGDRLQLVGPRGASGGSSGFEEETAVQRGPAGGGGGGSPRGSAPVPPMEDFDDDIPF